MNYIYKRIEPGQQGLDEIWYPKLEKWLLMVDHDAQLVAEQYLEKNLRDIKIRGEESTLKKFDGGLAALLDMLDGSDLLKRNLGNWCSAATIFDVDSPKIITALVGMPSGEIYFVRNADPTCAFLRPPNRGEGDNRIRQVRMERRELKLQDASICFYGQKPGKLSSFCSSKRKMGRWLKQTSKVMDSKKRAYDCPKMRIYTLAGNPMMISLIEDRIDAVVELSGQRCHDVVPGFVIALRAGAVLRDLSNKPITEERIAESLRNPEHKFAYVLACSENLATELVELLQPTMSLVS